MKILKALLATLILFGLIYLMGAFANNSFDIGLWSTEFRFMTGVFGGVISMVVGVIVLVLEMNMQDERH